ncbi:hypothetical protein HMPREF2531_03247 [Bacteroides intestinalis]|uniref:Uncharacterized protein n=1 Tax=Bacteroides intestinalis TaxID=329854 RepID=A0A139L3Q1_9BACE|nr:hypothetical protein HMPREF2531_03247 [Bacteroides intestinalis]
MYIYLVSYNEMQLLGIYDIRCFSVFYFPVLEVYKYDFLF